MDELGIEGFQLKYEEIRAADGSKYYYDEIELNRLGYRLINKGKLDQAILVFEANVELFPEAPNVYDSLGEVYRIKGKYDSAIVNYQKSLELDPGNTNAVEKLKGLRKHSNEDS